MHFELKELAKVAARLSYNYCSLLREAFKRGRNSCFEISFLEISIFSWLFALKLINEDFYEQ